MIFSNELFLEISQLNKYNCFYYVNDNLVKTIVKVLYQFQAITQIDKEPKISSFGLVWSKFCNNKLEIIGDNLIIKFDVKYFIFEFDMPRKNIKIKCSDNPTEYANQVVKTFQELFKVHVQPQPSLIKDKVDYKLNNQLCKIIDKNIGKHKYKLKQLEKISELFLIKMEFNEEPNINLILNEVRFNMESFNFYFDNNYFSCDGLKFEWDKFYNAELCVNQMFNRMRFKIKKSKVSKKELSFKLSNRLNDVFNKNIKEHEDTLNQLKNISKLFFSNLEIDEKPELNFESNEINFYWISLFKNSIKNHEFSIRLCEEYFICRYDKPILWNEFNDTESCTRQLLNTMKNIVG